MKVKELKEILEGTGAVVKETSHPVVQDPFVLYDREVYLLTKYFASRLLIKQYYENKMIIAMDCEDPDSGVDMISVRAYVHDPKFAAPKGTFREHRESRV
jgi:hypothetical protein